MNSSEASSERMKKLFRTGPPLVIDRIPIPVEKMKCLQLKSFIRRMIKSSTGRKTPRWGKKSTRPPWWPQDLLPWANIKVDARTKHQKKVKFTQVLRQIVIKCYKYYGREDLLTVLSGDHEDADTRKPEINKLGQAGDLLTEIRPGALPPDSTIGVPAVDSASSEAEGSAHSTPAAPAPPKKRRKLNDLTDGGSDFEKLDSGSEDHSEKEDSEVWRRTARMAECRSRRIIHDSEEEEEESESPPSKKRKGKGGEGAEEVESRSETPCSDGELSVEPPCAGNKKGRAPAAVPDPRPRRLKTVKVNEVIEWNGLRYYSASMQGRRPRMNDAHSAVMGLPGPFKKWAFFGVFDGHGGNRVSSHCADNLLDTIIQTEEFSRSAGEEDVEEIEMGIRDGFLLLDDKMRTIPKIGRSGSTAVCVLISPTHMYIANCGDSRAVLCRAGQAFVTEDHKPDSPGEKERIEKAGGFVSDNRVNGGVAVSRSLGDYKYKNVKDRNPCDQLVSPEPEIYVQQRSEKSDEFIILACDGVWDVMMNDDLVTFVRTWLTMTTDLKFICNEVIDKCFCKGSTDNLSIILVTFRGCPTPPTSKGLPCSCGSVNSSETNSNGRQSKE